MPAPKGNNFWELRSKHGRDKLFGSPKIMWQAACEYFAWCVNNPLIEIDYRSGKKIQLPKMRPFTLHGLCHYLNCNSAYFRSFKSQERALKEDFITVIADIEETIYNQKFTGAAVGFLNANIISRDLGLSDRQELTGKNGEPLTQPFNDSQVDKIIQSLRENKTS